MENYEILKNKIELEPNNREIINLIILLENQALLNLANPKIPVREAVDFYFKVKELKEFLFINRSIAG